MGPWLLITLINFASIFAQECITPNGVRAECTLLDDCDPVYDFIVSHQTLVLSRRQRQYINLLQCFEDDYGRSFVCCAADDPFFERNKVITSTTEAATTIGEIPIGTVETRIQIGNLLPNPKKYECGSDILSNRIVGGTDAELGEFPWMALLEYQHPTTNARAFACGGSLIHSRYVLTAAHCLIGSILRVKGQLSNVRLGEHNLNTTSDCEITETGEEICAAPVFDVGVEYTIAHPNFTQIGIVPYNDIGLVRLARDIATTEFIQPICFPNTDLQTLVGMKLTVSGWGRTGTTSRSEIKQKVTLPLIEFGRCQETFYPVNINPATQICAGAEFGKDSCNGDSGGPLMTFVNGSWFIEGLVSFGLSPCGLDGISGIYTRVNSYTDWILATII